uniref:Uncharacterized protein n=1 Tax=viral metagenome TaxID=1070528 RepID=A0A6C0J5B1_9ZZZZ
MSTDFVKQTLRENLARTLVPHVSDGLWSIYDNAKTAAERNKQPDQILKTFQNLLTRVPEWKEDVLTTEVDRIIKVSKCDYIEDLLLGVFVSYIRAFATLQQADTTHVDIDFTRPSVNTFVHALYKASARQCWTNAYLFKTVGVPSEQQARNRRDIETLVGNCMNDVIDSFIPWKTISKAYFQSPAPTPARPGTPIPPPVPEPIPEVKFGENETREFTSSESDDEEAPAIQLGEDVTLGDDDFEEDDAKSTGSVHLEEPKESIKLAM